MDKKEEKATTDRAGNGNNFVVLRRTRAWKSKNKKDCCAFDFYIASLRLELCQTVQYSEIESDIVAIFLSLFLSV